jgi:pimeloyl-ACP methyl ester carboxylesterase
MSLINVNGCRLYYTVQGQGTAILFIHPPGVTHINFRYQMNELSKYFRVISFDIRGHGRSQFSEQTLTYPLIVEDIKQLLDHLEIQKAFISGYSAGGSIALEFLLSHPERAIGGIVISGMSEVNDWVLKSRMKLGVAVSLSRATSTLASGGATGIQRASHLIYEAKQSVGDMTALVEAKQDLQRLLEQYECILEMLEKIEKDILSLLGEIPLAEQMRSIKGLGPIFTAAILSSAGDLKKYAHGRQLLRRAGLNLAESTSGKRKGQIILSKRGDAALRKYMYLATIQLVANNPETST